MKKILIFAGLFIILFSNCKKNIDITKNLDGKWKIVSVEMVNIDFWAKNLANGIDTNEVKQKIITNMNENLLGSIISFGLETKTCRIGESDQLYDWHYDQSKSVIYLTLRNEEIKSNVEMQIEDFNEKEMTVLMTWYVSGNKVSLRMVLQKQVN